MGCFPAQTNPGWPGGPHRRDAPVRMPCAGHIDFGRLGAHKGPPLFPHAWRPDESTREACEDDMKRPKGPRCVPARSGTKKSAVFALGVLVLVGALFEASRSAKKPPGIPPDEAHRAARTNESCAPCHGKIGPAPLSAGHPPKEDCLYCHPGAG